MLRIIPMMALIIMSSIVYPQKPKEVFSYVSPLPGSEMIMPGQNIAFRFNQFYKTLKATEFKLELIGSQSGIHTGCLNLASDGNTWIYEPDQAFEGGEHVTVNLLLEHFQINETISWGFNISTISTEKQRDVLKQIIKQETEPAQAFTIPEIKTDIPVAFNDSLPEGFPEISITHWTDPSDGYIFVCPLTYQNGASYLMILDNHHTPVYYRSIPLSGGFDFKLQPNGQLSFFLPTVLGYIIMNDHFEIVDTISTGNGYTTDLHELRLYENGHAFLLAYDPQLVDMSQVVPGGYEQAIVTGLIVQELDENEDVVFQWRSWDHYEITDVSDWISLTDSTIDYVHGNSIEVLSDSALLISSRNMNEITKIHRGTGDILWRMNGKKNMFTFADSNDLFCVQHAIRLMPDSTNLSIFDNGGCHSPQLSSAMEFSYNEENLTATLEQKMRSEPDIFGAFMGNTQRLQNGNAINGWGNGIPSVTEFDSEGNILLEFSFPHTNYRAFKFDWQHDLFYADPGFISLDSVAEGDTVYVDFEIHNTYSMEIEINRFVNRDTNVSLLTELPVTIAQDDFATFEVMFVALNPGNLEDDLTLCWEIDSDTLLQRTAVQVNLQGYVKDVNNVTDTDSRKHISIYPNPSSGEFNVIAKTDMIQSVRIKTMEGKTVFIKEKINVNRLKVGNRLSPGIYLIEITLGSGRMVTSRVIMN